MDKKEAIETANSIVVEKYPSLNWNANLFDIKVLKNSKHVLVEFHRVIKFIPLGSQESDFVFDLKVDITENIVMPFDFGRNLQQLAPLKEPSELLRTYLRKLKLPRGGFIHTINETSECYKILISNKYAFAKYCIDKMTGEQCQAPIEGSHFVENEPIGLPDIDPYVEIV